MKAATFVMALNRADVLRLSTEICPVITGHKRQAPQATMDGTVDSTVESTVDDTVDNYLATSLRGYLAT